MTGFYESQGREDPGKGWYADGRGLSEEDEVACTLAKGKCGEGRRSRREGCSKGRRLPVIMNISYK